MAEDHQVRLRLGEDGGEPPESLGGRLARYAGRDDADAQQAFQDLRGALSVAGPVPGGEAVAEGQNSPSGIEPGQALAVPAGNEEEGENEKGQQGRENAMPSP